MLDVDNTFRKLRESRSLLVITQAQREAASEKLREVNDQFRQSAVLLRDVLKQEVRLPTPTMIMKTVCWRSGMRRRRSKSRWVRSNAMHCVNFHSFAGYAVVASLLFAGTGCKQQVAEAPVATPVRVASVQAISKQNGATYSASIVPYAQVDLAFQSGGYVDKIYQVRNPSGGKRNVDQGDWIAKGTVLAVVRQQDYLDKLQQAQAQLARSQAEQEKAKLSYDRVAALYSAQSATKPDYDSAKAQLDSDDRIRFRSAGADQRSESGARRCFLACAIFRMAGGAQRRPW